MRKFKLFLLFALLSCGILTSCGGNDSANQAAGNSNSLVVLNYGKYINPAVIRMFEEETGIDVKLEEYESPEEMYTKFSAGSISYDAVCTSDYMIERLIHEDEAAEIDFSSFSYHENIDSDIIDAAKAFDPEVKYSMPYFYGTLGILYNTTMVSEKEVETWNVLWDEQYKDSIIMQNSVRDSFVPALRLLNYDINTEDFEQLNEAVQLLIDQKPLVYAYYVDETADEMVAGNAAMALAYSGEAAYAMALNEDLSYTVPQEGSNLWIDSWFIPKSSTNKENAQKFLDFLCREDVALQNFSYVSYPTPNTKALAQIDDEIKNDSTIFPSDEVLSNCAVYRQAAKETTERYGYLWKILKSY